MDVGYTLHTFLNDRMAGRREHPLRNITLTIGETPWVTRWLSNLYPSSPKGSGVTLRIISF